MLKFVAVAVAVASMSTMVLAEGLPIGESVQAFYVKDVTGPSAGKKLCYRCRYGNDPVVSIFTRKVDGHVSDLIAGVDGVVGKNQSKDMKAFVVVLTDQPEAQEAELKKVAASKGITNTPLTTFDGPAGPANYQIAENAEVTVMMWVGGKLKVNEALSASDLTAEKINNVLGKTNSILN